ncbi:MAG: PqqD family peptide modification chaperone [Defluviitaleaceae bacterium]|nr:PqqD family peptide modification chaperone [Defluviitaleaceae bacterium]
MKLKLVFPPFWIWNSPYLSVPSLVAYLKQEGLEVEQMDLNLKCFDRMLSKEFLDFCIDKYINEVKEKEDPTTMQFMSEVGKFIADGIDEHKNLFRSEKALDIDVYDKCRAFLELGLSVINTAFPGEEVGHYEFSSTYSTKSFSSILKCTQDAYQANSANTLVNTLIEHFLDEVIRDADVIGVSLTSIEQIIPTFALLGAIRREAPAIKIVLGGSIITRWFSDAEKSPKIFDFVDYAIVNEGEMPLVALMRHLNGLLEIDDVPQLYYEDTKGNIIKNVKHVDSSDMELFPTPIFVKDDLPKYLSPVPTLPLLGSRGCYWGKCTFCDHYFVYGNSYRSFSASKIVEDIAIYIREYGVTHINFHDEAMRPRDFQTLSECLIDKKINIKWSTDARLDNNLTYEILQQSSEAGLKVLFFGLESINQRVLKLIKKGTNRNSVKRILMDATSLGIWSHLFFICGFPTETLEEYGETVDFIKSNANIIASHGCARFSLGKNSPIALNPEKFSVKIIEDNGADNASLSLKFKRLNTTDDYKRKIKKAYENATKKTPTYAQKISNFLFREHWVIFSDEKHKMIFHRKRREEKRVLNLGVFVIDGVDNLLVYDSPTSEIYEFDKSAKHVLELIDKYGCSQLEMIVSDSAKFYGVSEAEAEESIATFVELLTEKKLLYSSNAISV